MHGLISPDRWSMLLVRAGHGGVTITTTSQATAKRIDPLAARPEGVLGVALVAVLYVALYLLAALWGRDVEALPGITPWFPPAGLTVALLVGFGLRWAPLAFLAELTSGIVVYDIDSTFTAGQILLNTAAITAAYGGAAFLLRSVLRIDPALRDVRSLVWFGLLAVVVAPLVAGLAGVAMRDWAGAGSDASYLDEVRTWWVGDAIGVVSVAPAALAVGSALLGHRGPRIGRLHFRAELVAQTAAVAIAPFAIYAIQGDRHRLLFLAVLPVLWVALTRGFLMTAVAVLYTNAACTLAADWQGPGALDLTDVQSFMLTLAVMALGAAAGTRELRRSRAEIAHRASHDPLTQLPNRGEFFTRLRGAVATERELAVVFFDVDRLKIVGDSLGFEVMDRLLVQIGDRVSAAVSDGCLVSRYGGDEFAVLVVGADAGTRSERAAERIVNALRVPFRVGDQEIVALTSVGVAVAEDEGEDAGRVLRRADIARAQAKRRGGDRWVVYDEALGTLVRARHALERGLRAALANEEFDLAFQPIYALPHCEVTHVEALVRWRHPKRGLVSAGEFIPLAEEVGLVAQIGRFVLDRACKEAVRWPATSAAGPPSVTVNVSVSQLLDDALVDDVEHALAESGLPAERLALEITETMALQDPEATVAFLHRLRAIGVELMIDDFGSGYSSLGYLHRLPVAVVKVDRAFTSDLGPGRPGEAVVGAVGTLADNLGLRVVAEGVETSGQLTRVRLLGCDAAQGFGLARPMPAVELETVLASSAQTSTTTGSTIGRRLSRS
jgi:diguanylate cyclase (GGDEF)-like protein